MWIYRECTYVVLVYKKYEGTPRIRNPNEFSDYDWWQIHILVKSEVHPYSSIKCILFNPRTCICKGTRLESVGSNTVLSPNGPGPKHAVDG
jgi:hypothetical protein